MKGYIKVFSTSLIALALFVALVMTTQVVQPVSAQGGVTGFSNIRITNFYRAAERTAITVTTNGTLNPSGTNQPLTAAFPGAGLSGNDITVEASGSILILTNVSTNTITFTETGTLISAGNIVLGENDSATLLSDGTDWRQIGASNN